MRIKQQKHMRSSAPSKWIALIGAAILAVSLVALAGCASSSGSSSASGSGSAASASASSSGSSASAGTQLQVPNVVALERADAIKLIQQAGFATIETQIEYSDTVAQGVVISQKPTALSMASSNAPITIVVSRGKQSAADVQVPNLIGMSLGEAEQALAKLNLIPVPGAPEVNTDVAPGKVCKQSVKAGTTVKEGTKITFTTALAKETVAVPNVTGKSYNDAKAALEKAGLGTDPSSAYSDTVAKDNVISQSVPANTQVTKGTIVKVIISLGPQPKAKVKVPYILTASLEEAICSLTSAGLNYRYSGDVGGTVASMTPDAGTEVDVGSTVTFVLENASTSVAVPAVAGMMGSDARAAFDLVGLNLDYDVRHPDRVLSGTMPAAGTLLDKGSFVMAVYPPEEESADMKNPWTTTKSGAEAAAGAGLDRFDIMDSATAGGQTLGNPEFSYISGIAQASYNAGSIRIVVRKGSGVSGADLHGNYNSYAELWAQNFKGLTIKCQGDEQGQAKLIEWSFGGNNFSCSIDGAAMSADEVSSLVAGIQ